jgi:hypothetical protein
VTRPQLWLLAFVWTNALELPIYTLVLQRRFRRWWSVVALTLALNAVTHPALWFVAPQFQPFWLYALVAEAAVITVEAAMVAAVLAAVDRRAGVRRPVIGIAAGAAAAANIVSAVVGGVIVSLC